MTQQDNDSCWDVDQENALTRIKEAVSNTPVLRFFDAGKAPTIQCDASSTGLGTVPLQEGQPVAYASRSLFETEQRYAQIEELLAVVFSFEKFDQYLYGRKVTVHSDHRPLQAITAKPIATAPKRLQRMLLRLQRYDFIITGLEKSFQ